ncbi:MAG: PAS domain-containing protein [Fibrobacterales bacterium]
MSKKIKQPKQEQNNIKKQVLPDAAPDIDNSETPIVEEEEEEEELSTPLPGFPIVGIGASAGGLSAFEAFFSGMPSDTNPGMAFIIVQHLAPDHKSILTELIQRYTRMQVYEVEDGMTVEINCAYIIPPNRDMAFLNGSLQLMEPSAPRGQRLPINFFFRTLAQDQRERAICIVLSGTGSDGTQGLRAIKGDGGMSMVQNPESTEYDGMPRSAIATGLVDYILPPAEMPAQLIGYASHIYGKPPTPISSNSKNKNALNKIFILLRTQTSHDFSQYKPSTIRRRIERRMAVQQISTLSNYVECLQKTPEEIEALFRDLLIGVTNFFRDPEAFAALETTAIPEILKSHPTGSTIRVWTPGCSTGEEAYSIAILFQELMDELKQSYKIQIFATDIDNNAIATARAGVYPESISQDILPERLTRYFTSENDGTSFRINKSIRDMLVFSEQDIVKDPPFSKLDLITCRNLLIYMGGDLQKKLIPLFQYALNKNGILFLGTSEAIGEFGDLFTELDRKAKLFKRKDDLYASQRSSLGRFIPSIIASGVVNIPLETKITSSTKLPLREITEKALLKEIAPAGALVDSHGDILYIHGRTGRFLEPMSGEAGVNNILKMAREGLHRDLTSALHKATLTKEAIRYQNLRVKTNGDYSLVNLTVRPVNITVSKTPETPLFMVILDDTPSIENITPIETPLKGDSTTEVDASILALKQELRTKEEYLQTTNEELETSIEELKSSNEEMQSVNEELQSTNEELETSKEELQSVNEELATVNTELQTKVAELSRANNDMNNLLAGTGIGTVFVDHSLHILRFTPTATQIINLILSDIGRPVGHIVSNLIEYDTLVGDIQAVLHTLIPKEVEVQTNEKKWFTMRIQPYRTLENVIEGAVITFVDISEMKLMKAELDDAKGLSRLGVIVNDSNDAITVQDLEGRILTWNKKAEDHYGWSQTEALAMNIRELFPKEEIENALTIIDKLCNGEVVEPMITKRISKNGQILNVQITSTTLVNEDSTVYAIATTERLLEK